MFDLQDRLWAYLLGLKQVQARLLGEDIGFFVQAQSGAQTLFCTFTNPEAQAVQFRYRFHLSASSRLPETFCYDCVKGWPGWMQVINPSSQDEEALWQCVTRAYQEAAQLPSNGGGYAQP